MTLVPASSTGLAGVAAVTAADASIVVGGTGTNPTVRGQVLVATVSLDSAHLLALTETPVQVVATPGAGKMVCPFLWEGFYTFVSIPYVAPQGGPQLLWGTAAGVVAEGSAPFDCTQGATNGGYQLCSGTSSSPATVAQVTNQPLVVAVPVADMIAGDGTVKMTVYYTIVTI